MYSTAYGNYYRYMHGKISQKEAIARLKAAGKEGTFLLRASASRNKR